ncbi:unnamed protein product [Ilex paraguariensis]|uniref:Uncharacterized protein n=1 Tax=Ilex paraguariensis TaxID=185542 RepID=A0ABC8UTG0_9AQUA
MKKLYSKSRIHPSSQPAIADHLSLLPATILTLTVALSPEDKQVLAYLISCCSNNSKNFSGHRKTTQKSGRGGGGGGGGGGGSGGDHPPQFDCNCFRCYMSYWVRWDNSPDRQLIHEIIDAYEEGLYQNQKKTVKNKKQRRKRVCNLSDDHETLDSSSESNSVEMNCSGDVHVDHQVCGEDGGEVGLERGSVKKLVSFIGEKIWRVWGI